MKKSIFIVGKDSPHNLPYIAKATENARSVLVAVTDETSQDSSEAVSYITWNRASPISARTLILAAKNKFSVLHDALIIFDGNQFAEDIKTAHLNDFSKACDQFILSYTYICTELLTRLAKTRLIFLLKTAPTHVNHLKGQTDSDFAALPISIAQAAFEALAENIQLQNKATPITLLKGDSESDEEIAEWLFPFLETTTEKNSSGWIKVCTKTQGLFSFFR